jgi:hypothetical protein
MNRNRWCRRVHIDNSSQGSGFTDVYNAIDQILSCSAYSFCLHLELDWGALAGSVQRVGPIQYGFEPQQVYLIRCAIVSNVFFCPCVINIYQQQYWTRVNPEARTMVSNLEVKEIQSEGGKTEVQGTRRLHYLR